jgi:anhydro-N-acetylmuramic acid kinase
MSGTSIDAIDAAACEFDETGRPLRIIGARSSRYPPALREELLSLQRRPDTPVSLRDVVRLDAAVGDAFASAANDLLRDLALRPRDILAIGSHGQTVFHDPVALHGSLQIGDPNRIAAGTAIRTVADFRRADLARGGQGAPLVPAFHAATFSDPRRSRIVLNVGGIANLTILPAAGGAPVSGFDTGPGNALLDDWILATRGHTYDHEGQWAASGTLHAPLLARCLEDPYFAAPAPKSTGRDYFHLDWLRARAGVIEALAAADVQCSLLELTVETIARAVESAAPETQEMFVCGGGARNRQMMERLRRRLPSLSIHDTGALGVDADWVEASAFAWLAWRTLHGLAGSLPAVTGAAVPAVLGGIYAA